jgi:hypothetical protein
MLTYNLEHIFSYTARVRLPPEVIGPIPEGIRTTAYIIGGEMHGPRLQGTVLPVGGDWLLLRRDGIGLVDVRLTLQTHDDALIYAAYTGVLDFGPEGYEKFLAGELPETCRVRTAPRFQTSHPGYVWINRLQCLAIGEADMRSATVSYDVYSVD